MTSRAEGFLDCNGVGEGGGEGSTNFGRGRCRCRGGGWCRRVQEDQLITLFQFKLHRRLDVEDWVQVDARAVQVDDVQVEHVHDGVAHLVHSLRGVLDGSLNDFPEDVGAYHGDFFDGLSGM